MSGANHLQLRYLDLKDAAPEKGESTECTDPHAPIPEYVPAAAPNNFCYESKAGASHIVAPQSRIVFYYEIYSSPSQDSGDYLDGYAFVPAVGKNELSCTIVNRTTEKVDPNAPYTCSTSWGDSNPHSIDPQPHWVLTQKPTVVVDGETDPVDKVKAAMKDVLDTCGHGLSNCTADATNQKVFKVPEGAGWRVLGKPYVNGTKDKVTYEYKDGWKLSWKDSLKFEAEYDFSKTFPKLGFKISSAYEHVWGSEANSELTYRMTIEPGDIGVFFLQPGYLAVTGNFQVVYPDKVEIVKNVTINYPLSDTYKPSDAVPTWIYDGVVIGCTMPASQNEPVQSGNTVCPGGKLTEAQVVH